MVLYREHLENNMANIASVLREEILRLARKELRKQTVAFKKASAQYRRDIAAMKRRISDLQRRLGSIERQTVRTVPDRTVETGGDSVRFTAKGLRSQRKRLALSAADYGKLVGVTGQSIYSWEREASRPRKQQVARIAAIRHLGKKEAQARVEQLAGGSRKKSA
jgi:DNA-binding transcriptional regulator YiaG